MLEGVTDDRVVFPADGDEHVHGRAAQVSDHQPYGCSILMDRLAVASR